MKVRETIRGDGSTVEVMVCVEKFVLSFLWPPIYHIRSVFWIVKTIVRVVYVLCDLFSFLMGSFFLTPSPSIWLWPLTLWPGLCFLTLPHLTLQVKTSYTMVNWLFNWFLKNAHFHWHFHWQTLTKVTWNVQETTQGYCHLHPVGNFSLQYWNQNWM